MVAAPNHPPLVSCNLRRRRCQPNQNQLTTMRFFVCQSDNRSRRTCGVPVVAIMPSPFKRANNYRKPPTAAVQVTPDRRRSRGEVLNLRNARNTSDGRSCARQSPIVSSRILLPATLVRTPRTAVEIAGQWTSIHIGIRVGARPAAIIRADL